MTLRLAYSIAIMDDNLLYRLFYGNCFDSMNLNNNLWNIKINFMSNSIDNMGTSCSLQDSDVGNIYTEGLLFLT